MAMGHGSAFRARESQGAGRRFGPYPAIQSNVSTVVPFDLA